MEGPTSKVLSETVSIRAAGADGERTERDLVCPSKTPSYRLQHLSEQRFAVPSGKGFSADVSTPLYVEGDLDHVVSGRQETSPHVETSRFLAAWRKPRTLRPSSL